MLDTEYEIHLDDDLLSSAIFNFVCTFNKELPPFVCVFLGRNDRENVEIRVPQKVNHASVSVLVREKRV